MDKNFNVLSFGAEAGTVIPQTKAIQSAVNVCMEWWRKGSHSKRNISCPSEQHLTPRWNRLNFVYGIPATNYTYKKTNDGINSAACWCEDADNGGNNLYLLRPFWAKNASSLILIADTITPCSMSSNGWAQQRYFDNPFNDGNHGSIHFRHGKQANTLFVDGHAGVLSLGSQELKDVGISKCADKNYNQVSM